MQNKFFLKFKNIGRIKDFAGNFEYYENEDFHNKPRPSLINKFSILAVMFFLVLLGSKLFLLQVQEGFINLSLAEGNRIRSLPLAAPRGLILDKNGQVLASNEFTYELVVQASQPEDIDKESEDIFQKIGFSKEEVKDKIKDRRNLSGFVVLRENIPHEEALILKSKIPVYGRFEVIPVFVRKYAHESLAHLVGYVGRFNEKDQEKYPEYVVNKFIGRVGLERVYDKYLQGLPGSRNIEVDASGKLIRVMSTKEPLSGNTLHTTIDLELQKIIYDKFKSKNPDKKGAVIALDPRDGTIRAMVSFPSYDPTVLSRGISEDDYKKLIEDKNNPLLNRAVSGVYPSGSTIKPFIATAALEAGVVDENTAFETPPFIEVGEWKFPDWKDHGYTDIKTAIAESNNIFFYAIGGGWGPVKNPLGPSGIEKGLSQFGFGAETGVDLQSEQKGFIPTPQWKEQTTGESWYIGNTYHLSIGQGDLLVTPMQIANATAAIANNGVLYSPRSVREIAGSNDEVILRLDPENYINDKDIFSEDNLRIVKEGMRKTVTSGSAHAVFGDNFIVSVSGKTGTAQFGHEDKTHAWFTCFAPHDEPELVLTVIVEDGGEGYESAAPVAKDVLEYYFSNTTK